jgi:hypothetical protein
MDASCQRLPNEVIEKILRRLVDLSGSTVECYNNLRSASFTSSYFFERLRPLKLLDVRVYNDKVKIGSRKHYELRRFAAEAIQPLPPVICDYIKVIAFEGNSNEMYHSFNKMISKPLNLESLSFDSRCEKSDPNIIDSSCIASIDNLSLQRCPRFLTRMSSDSFKSLKSVNVKCRNSNLYYLSRLDTLDTEVNLTLKCSIRPETPLITLPVHGLELDLYSRPVLDCFTSYADTLTSLHIECRRLIGDEPYIYSFLSGALKLQKLKVARFYFDRPSLLATLQAAISLKDLQLVTFTQIPERIVLLSVEFFFSHQTLESIVYTDYRFFFPWANDHTDRSDWLIEELFDMGTFTVKDAFIEKVFGVKGGVPLKYLIDSKWIKTREEFDRCVALSDEAVYSDYEYF